MSPHYRWQLTLLCTCFPLIIFGQHNDRVDSLKTKLFSTITKDSTYINLLHQLSVELRRVDPAEGEKYALEAIALAEKQDYTRGIAYSYRALGLSYLMKSQYQDARKAFLRSLDVSRKLEDVSIQSRTLGNLAMTYTRMQDFKSALECNLHALKLAAQLSDRKWVASLYNNIGIIYEDQDQPLQAMSFYKRSYQYAKEVNDLSLIGNTANNIALVLNTLKKYDSAIIMLNESRSARSAYGDKWGVGSCLLNLAITLNNLGRSEEALKLLEQSMAVKKDLADNRGLMECLTVKTGIQIRLRKLNDAKVSIASAYDLMKKIKIKDPGVFEMFAEMYESNGNYQKALAWRKEFQTLRDSLVNEKKSRQLAELQTNHDVAEKEKQILMLEKQSEEERYSRNLSLGVTAGILVLLSSIIYIVRLKARKKLEIHGLKANLLQQQLETSQLKELELKREIERKNKELTSYTMNFVQKSQLMEELKTSLNMVHPKDEESARKLQTVYKLLDSNYRVDREWEDFKTQFENVHTDFFKVLKTRYPDLTSGDLKLCALLRLNMSIKQAAQYLGQDPDSNKTARWRLRQKLKLPKNTNLVEFLSAIDKPEETEKKVHFEVNSPIN